MKPDIHPRYEISQVTCACGNAFTTRSTLPVIKLEICSACHPFFTGRQKLLDTAGRLERFQKRFAKTEGRMVARKNKVGKKNLVAIAPAKKMMTTAPRKRAEKETKEKKSKPKA
ncbi:MAG: 50S ribosomal protein L31 [Elusimicrobia bacterium RIFCSPLOWO2_12_FULL_59_9]|nr:50S ribosomal protein L31 [Elusimicrobiota bacterium]OGS02034.1 MAG: 50S ribosomal protein L31 [Elusimicrobia bacterium RIFCSPLOWO2_12_FULL_59_9]